MTAGNLHDLGAGLAYQGVQIPDLGALHVGAGNLHDFGAGHVNGAAGNLRDPGSQ